MNKMESRITLADVKKTLTDKTVSYTLDHLDHKEFGLDVWHITALENTGNNSLRKRNYRVFSQGTDESSPAWWDDLQKPVLSQATSSSPSPTFSEELRDGIKQMIVDGKIQFAEILAVDEQNKRARLKVVTSQYAEKQMLVVKTESGFETQEITT